MSQAKLLVKSLVGASVVAAVPAFAVLDAAITTAVADSVAEILLVIALGGAAFVTISSGGVIWNVVSKFIKRLGGKA